MSDYRKDTVQHLYESGFRELVVTGVGEVEAREDRISDLERRNGELGEALRDLMDWQIKNVAAPDNPAYNAAHDALARTKEQTHE